MNELWKNIDIATNYEVSNMGNIRNTKSGQILEPGVSGNGYKQVSIKFKDTNKFKKQYVHRLVAQYWLDNPENKPTVDHIDRNPKNNNLSNLRWATYGEQNSRFETLGVRSEAIIVNHYEEKRKKRGGGHEAWLGIIETLEFDSISETA